MEKKEIETVTREVVRRYCDDCGREIHSLKCNERKCNICGKDLCENDFYSDSEESDHNGWKLGYCDECYSIYQRYKPRLDRLSNETGRIWRDIRRQGTEAWEERKNGNAGNNQSR